MGTMIDRSTSVGETQSKPSLNPKHPSSCNFGALLFFVLQPTMKETRSRLEVELVEALRRLLPTN